jgi:hypothetical protein
MPWTLRDGSFTSLPRAGYMIVVSPAYCVWLKVDAQYLARL